MHFSRQRAHPRTTARGFVLPALFAIGSTGGLFDTERSVPPDAATAHVLPFVDEFDDDRNGWGGPFQRFENGTYLWELPSGQSDSRAPDTLIAVEDEIERVAVTAEVTVRGLLGVGFECAYDELAGSSQWYALELSIDGARIWKRPLGNTPVETLALDPSVTLRDGPVVLSAICSLGEGTYTLSLAVDGETVLETVDDEPFGAGAPGLFARAAVDGPGAPVHIARFDRFEATSTSPSHDPESDPHTTESGGR